MTKYRTHIIAAAVFALIVTLGLFYLRQIHDRLETEHRGNLLSIAIGAAHSVQKQTMRSLSATYALASLVQEFGDIEDFDSRAADMIDSYGGISSLQLAPNGVVSKIYPLAGNEKAIGHDLLNDPRRRTEALKTIESRQLTLAGPFELVQGGVAAIGRLPVFLHRDNGEEYFWGFTIVLLRLPHLLQTTNLSDLVNQGYSLELARTDPDTGSINTFYRSKRQSRLQGASFPFSMPNGEWTLKIAQLTHWRSPTLRGIEYSIVLLSGAIISFLTFMVLRQSESLEIQASELGHANRELQEALANVKTLSGLLPICSYCKKIRDDGGYWHQLEEYIHTHSGAEFTHGMCENCAKKNFPDLLDTG